MKASRLGQRRPEEAKARGKETMLVEPKYPLWCNPEGSFYFDKECCKVYR